MWMVKIKPGIDVFLSLQYRGLSSASRLTPVTPENDQYCFQNLNTNLL